MMKTNKLNQSKSNTYKIGGKEITILHHERVWQPSTFTLMLGEYLDQQDWKGKKVLDLGVGSGFLSIVVGKQTATEIVGVDLNPDAVKQSVRNWVLNNLPLNKFTAMESDRFQALEVNESYYNTNPSIKRGSYEYFDAIISNPPTAPELNVHSSDERVTAWLWNENGTDGRLVLDALIEEGHKYLKNGGKLIFINTSKQGIKKTLATLKTYYSRHRIIQEIDLEMAPYYDEYQKIWDRMEQQDQETRLYRKNNKIYQKLYFIEAIK